MPMCPLATRSTVALAAALALAWPHPAATAPLKPTDYASLGTLSTSSGAIVVDTSDKLPTLTLGSTTYKGVYVSQGPGLPDIAVFTFDAINVTGSATFSGSGTRPLALLSRGNVVITPTITFSGGAGVFNTIGGSAGAFGGAAHDSGPGAGTSGAGAGFGGSGGSFAFAAGGAAYGDLNLALQGGSGAGSTLGGGGAGALEIGAVGSVTVGTLLANGGAGAASPNGTASYGGGSGGAILLHGRSVTATSLQARGGSSVNANTAAGAGGGGGRVLAAFDQYVLGTTPLNIDVSGGTGGKGVTVSGLSGQAGVAELRPGLTVVAAGQVFLPGADGRMTLAGGTSLVTQAITLRTGGAAVAAQAWRTTGALSLEAGSAFTAASTLQLDHATDIAAGSGLTAVGRLTAGAGLTLGGGTVSALGGLATSSSLVGQGAVVGAVSGSASSTLRAQGGTLTVGDANRIGAVDWQGSITVAAQAGAPATLQLLSADVVTLPDLRLEGPGARLATLNGAQLAAGRVLTATDDARVSGTLRNDGLVQGPLKAGATLSFEDLVTGAGAYAGSVRFAGGFAPGFGAALVNAGNLDFATTNTLSLELGGRQRGTGYDAIDATGSIELGGLLDVALLSPAGGPFAPQAGDHFDLLHGSHVGGQFAALRLPALGNGLQWHSGTVADGGGEVFRLSVVAVPEPSPWALLLGGAGALGLRTRRRGMSRA